MRFILLALALTGLAGPSSVRADGLLIPTDRSLPPLALLHQRIHVTIEGQVATTTVEQVYRNHTDRDLEADYLFPVPPGASVREFAMWVGGKRYRGEALDASRARQTYEEIVRRLQDPGLLESVGRDLWKVRIFPVPRRGEQKIEIKFTAILPREGDLVAYQYLLRNGQAPRKTIDDFTVVVEIRSPDPLGPIYSPSHEVAINRRGDREAIVSFERTACSLDRDFLLYFTPRADGVGFSLLARRTSQAERGYFLLLLSPRAEPQSRPVPRDLVLVLDTSSSMLGAKLEQARAAVSETLGSLGSDDCFALIAFGTVPTSFQDGLAPATARERDAARAWIAKRTAEGGTDIGAALEEALKLRASSGPGRTFQVMFLTDGRPTVGVTDTEKILALVGRHEAAATRIFTFGVGDDVDAHLLDRLAEATRASSTYVRPEDDLKRKVAALAARIQLPVRTDLELKATGGARLSEIYPPRLPDLFQGEQLQVVGRYEGHGATTLTLEGRNADRRVSEAYTASFPEATTEPDFLAPLWAQRKVGYLLDQIRLNGESPEVKTEVTRLGREFAIATPYTSLLVVPETAPPASPRRGPQVKANPNRRPARTPAWTGMGRGGMGGMGGGMGGGLGGGMSAGMGGMGSGTSGGGFMLPGTPTSGPAAIDTAQRLAGLKTGARAEATEVLRVVAGYRFAKVTGVWVDERYNPTAPAVRLRAFSTAYFRLLDGHPEIRAILALGHRLIWVSPSGTALVIDAQGQDDVSAAVLDRLFTRSRG